jgi:DNA helicase-4
MNQESHDIHPSLILKFLGAKTLNLKVNNLEINSIHKSSSKFDITQIKKLKIKKGLLFNDLEVLLDTHSIVFKKLTKKQSKYLQFKFKNLRNIIKALDDIKYLTNSQKFINHRLIVKWISEYKELLRELNIFAKQKSALGIDELKILKFYTNYEKLINNCNDTFIKSELKKFKPLFDRIETHPLSLAQRKSIVTDEDSTLVVAGAGTGKTSTVVGKVSYLIKKKEIISDEILALAYGKDAAKEMRERVKEKTGEDIEIRTFHSIGRSIVQHYEGSKNKISDAATSEYVNKNLITNILREMLKNEKTRNLVMSFISYHRYPAKYLEDFKTNTDYFEYLRKHEPETLKGERVKSFEELLIADWLYLNGVYYEYEYPYEHKTSSMQRNQYRPDFFLGDSKYLEHFGINKEGRTAPQINSYEYNQSIVWKRNLHRQKRTTLIETYSWERQEGVILKNLEKKLSDIGISIKPNDPKIIKELFEREDVNKKLVSLVADFLQIFKEGQYTIKEISNNIPRINKSEIERYQVFIDLFDEVFKRYQDYLKKRQELDFADLISKSTDILNKTNFKTKFKRIIVDEYQDISRGRYKLLKALIKKQKDCRIMCVGDDWQSIYGFNGSDIRFTFDFEKVFGKTSRIDLDKSFRFTQPILDVSSRFIQKNPLQLKKKITSKPSTFKKTIEIIENEFGNQEYLYEVFKKINSDRPNNKKWDVIILGRYNHIEKEIPDDLKSKYKQLNIKFMSIHKSKGLGADVVVILKMESGKYGFPGSMENDPIMNLVRADEQEFANAEERRVFYVALTRAKQKIFMCANSYFPSTFIEELKSEEYPEVSFDISSVNKALLACPKCTNGKLFLKYPKRENGYAWVCSLSPYCDGKAKFCKECKKLPGTDRDSCLDPGCENS